MNEIPYLVEISIKASDSNNLDEYPFNIPAVANLKKLTFHPDVTFIIGENGSGKSTIIESIAIAMGFDDR